MIGLAACWEPDPRSLQGALAKAANAVEAGDARELFKVIDQRSRHALDSIAKDRARASRLIRGRYPPEAQARALAALGTSATEKTAAELFAERCDDACLAWFAQRLGAVRHRHRDGDEVVVTTTRGTRLRLYHGSDTWWGIVWKTDELDAERAQAARDLVQIRANAELYERRRRLQQTLDPPGR